MRMYLSAALLFAAGSLQAQKSEIETARISISSENLQADGVLEAKQSIDKAAVHKTTYNLSNMWLVRAMVYTRVYEKASHELLKDVSAGSGYISAYSMMRFWKSDNIKKYDIENAVLETRNSFGVGFNEAAEIVDKKLYDSAILYYQILTYVHSKMDTADINGLERSGITYKYLQERLAAIAMYVTDPKVKREVLTELVDGGSLSPVVYEGLSRTYLESGDTAMAEQIVRKGIAAAPGDNAMFQLLVNYYVSIGRTDLLFDDVSKQIEASPTSRLYFIRGTLWERKENFDAAIADYKEALVLDEFNYDANYNLGVALLKFETKKLYDKKSKFTNSADRAKVDLELKAVYIESRKYLEMAAGNLEYSVVDQINIYKALKTASLELDDKAGADGYQAKIDALEAVGKE
ncbi:MAG: tetratricopeptide repeat protein [Bacteroidia bacterium]|nr:tetratricopeptide repeat protein [Bacteroidia bacterium]